VQRDAGPGRRSNAVGGTLSLVLGLRGTRRSRPRSSNRQFCLTRPCSRANSPSWRSRYKAYDLGLLPGCGCDRRCAGCRDTAWWRIGQYKHIAAHGPPRTYKRELGGDSATRQQTALNPGIPAGIGLVNPTRPNQQTPGPVEPDAHPTRQSDQQPEPYLDNNINKHHEDPCLEAKATPSSPRMIRVSPDDASSGSRLAGIWK
jgi:hypothetical protein